MSFRRTAVSIVAAGMAVLFAVSGCGSSAEDSTSPSSGNVAKDAGAPGDPQQQKAAPGAAPVKAPENIQVETRAIIYSGGITVRVSTVDDAAAKATALATGAGGFVGGEERRSDDRRSEARLTLRVPSDKFASVMESRKAHGDEETRTVSTQDVTEQLVDVEARIATAQASVDRVRALLARAQTIGEITSLESELARREADLESLKSRKRKLDGLTALSTISVVLLGPEASLSNDDSGFLSGLADGWSAFLASAVVAITVIGWLLPWALLLGVPVWLLIVLMRRMRRNRPVRQPLVPALAFPGAAMAPQRTAPTTAPGPTPQRPDATPEPETKPEPQPEPEAEPETKAMTQPAADDDRPQPPADQPSSR